MRRQATLKTLIQVVLHPVAATVSDLHEEVLHPVTDMAVAHRVAGSLIAALHDAGRELPERLAEQGARAALAHLQVLRTLDTIVGALRSAGIRWALVKGPAIATRWPHGATARSYDDLDLLVSPGDLRRAAMVLTGLGFKHRNHNWAGFTRLGVAEIPLDDANMVIDLHWDLVALASDRRWLGTSADELLDRAVPLQLGSHQVLTLDDADTLTHLCCHSALAGARTLLQLRDVHLMAGVADPRVARERIERAGASRLAAAVLDRAERTFGAIGADPIATRLCGHRAWITANRVIDHTWAGLAGRASTDFPGAVISAGRPTMWATTRTMSSQVDKAVRTRMRLPTVVSPGGPLAWDTESGGAEGYESYLAFVEATHDDRPRRTAH